MGGMLRANQQVLAYLTPEAQERVKVLMAKGVDADLALMLIENIMPEEMVFDLPPEEAMDYEG